MKPHQKKWRDLILRRKEINLDIGNLCTLECPRCIRSQLPRPVPGHNMTIDEFTKLAKYFDKILLCGQVSDPIFNPNLIDFIKISKEQDVDLRVHTAASQRPINWWSEAFDAMYNKSRWVFGLDGLPKDSHKYRINQDGEHIWEMMKLAVNKGVTVHWQYIVFEYNKNDISQCKKMAESHNIVFDLMLSSRWAKHDDPYKPTDKNLRIDVWR